MSAPKTDVQGTVLSVLRRLREHHSRECVFTARAIYECGAGRRWSLSAVRRALHNLNAKGTVSRYDEGARGVLWRLADKIS